MLATALKRSQSIIKEVQSEMREQQAAHVEYCRQRAMQASKMARLSKLQRRVAELSSRKLQQQVQCLRAGDPPLSVSKCAAAGSMVDGVWQRCDGRERTQQVPTKRCSGCGSR